MAFYGNNVRRELLGADGGGAGGGNIVNWGIFLSAPEGEGDRAEGGANVLGEEAVVGILGELGRFSGTGEKEPDACFADKFILAKPVHEC